MNLKVHFYLEEKIKLLEKLGYEVKKITKEMSYPCYHNDVEIENEEIWAVFRNGKEYQKPGGYNFKKEDWIDGVFQDEVSNKLSKIILD